MDNTEDRRHERETAAADRQKEREREAALHALTFALWAEMTDEQRERIRHHEALRFIRNAD